MMTTNKSIYKVDNRIDLYLSRRKYFEKRYKKYLEKILEFTYQGRLLDVGCNIGLFLNFAQKYGFDPVGVEINDDCASYGKKQFKINIINGKVESAAFLDDSFDVVTLFDVLEHIPDFNSLLIEIKRILKPNGLLLIQSPNIDSIMASVTKSKWNWLSVPDHLYHFTPDTLIKLLVKHNYQVKKIYTWEPAEDFYNNLITLMKFAGIMGKIFEKGMIMSRLGVIPIFFLQKIWWHFQRGALIEVYAINRK
jgi:2-polyprenyl-3-methyl-5-hydroxy-6-metoxy-1,4-benzoquinol methylase